MPHEEWCDLLSTMEAKDNIKRAAYQIKRLAASKVAPANSGSDTSAKVPLKKKARTAVLLVRKR